VANVLLIGYGNPGRLDDGLGPALAEAVEHADLAGVRVDCNYQLSVEDAHSIANSDVVIFADADVAGPEPYYLKRIRPKQHVSFSSHSIDPASLLGLARDLFGTTPEAYVLGIRGYEFNEFGERLSEQARSNLGEAVAFILKTLEDGEFSEFRPQADPTTEFPDTADG